MATDAPKPAENDAQQKLPPQTTNGALERFREGGRVPTLMQKLLASPKAVAAFSSTVRPLQQTPGYLMTVIGAMRDIVLHPAYEADLRHKLSEYKARPRAKITDVQIEILEVLLTTKRLSSQEIINNLPEDKRTTEYLVMLQQVIPLLAGYNDGSITLKKRDK